MAPNNEEGSNILKQIEEEINASNELYAELRDYLGIANTTLKKKDEELVVKDQTISSLEETSKENETMYNEVLKEKATLQEDYAANKTALNEASEKLESTTKALDEKSNELVIVQGNADKEMNYVLGLVKDQKKQAEEINSYAKSLETYKGSE